MAPVFMGVVVWQATNAAQSGKVWDMPGPVLALAAFSAAAISFVFPRFVAHPQTRFIVGMAFCDLIAILGVLHAVLLGDWRIYPAYGLACFSLMLLRFPQAR